MEPDARSRSDSITARATRPRIAPPHRAPTATDRDWISFPCHISKESPASHLGTAPLKFSPPEATIPIVVSGSLISLWGLDDGEDQKLSGIFVSLDEELQ